MHSGRILHAGYDSVLYGNYLTIHGEGEGRSYFYSHLPRPSPFDRGDRVYTGQRVGAVGMTGNARTVGCHLHFEIHAHGRPIDPEPALERWAGLDLSASDLRSPSRGPLRPRGCA